ncbi:zinc ribbon domain-containing protein [Hyphomicrobium sp.]|uniref:zinc ribbon domain-containing protein n=1 Tax=Hyphomicrobium sp. TaxID=82 RepID=UPI002E31D321|nr:zinc ribbon domain-containing protein [Hyphomicrobium sp.]HEX2841360.1 zinc ribbon domain-containing protein [Hyphomicrobium sp.]
MTLRTGKSGRYRYYTCATCAQKGKAACMGRSIPMDKLDRLVSEKLAERLLAPERVEELLSGLMQRQGSRNEDHAKRLAALQTKLAAAETRLRRLYDAIEAGIADPSDPTLKDRVAVAKQDRDIAQASLDRAKAELRPGSKLTPDKIAAFAEVMRKNVLEGDTPSSTKFR